MSRCWNTQTPKWNHELTSLVGGNIIADCLILWSIASSVWRILLSLVKLPNQSQATSTPHTRLWKCVHKCENLPKLWRSKQFEMTLYGDAAVQCLHTRFIGSCHACPSYLISNHSMWGKVAFVMCVMICILCKEPVWCHFCEWYLSKFAFRWYSNFDIYWERSESHQTVALKLGAHFGVTDESSTFCNQEAISVPWPRDASVLHPPICW